MKGSEGIKELQHVVLNGLISVLPKRQVSRFSGILPDDKNDSDKIKWEVEYSSTGMTPFVAPGAPAPLVGIDGVGEGSASAAYFKEKMFFDEVFLNNMRKPGTTKHHQASQRLASAISRLDYRCERRKDWMVAKALIDGGFTYVKNGGQRFTVNYGIPESHFLTLASDRKWSDGANRNAVEDIFDAKEVLANDAGLSQSDLKAYCNTSVLKMLMLDTKVQGLLAKSAFGEGDLFKNPSAVIGMLLGVGPLELVDDLYEITGWLMGDITGGSTNVIPIDNVTDYEAGGTLRVYDLSKVNSWEDRIINSIDKVNSTATVASAYSRSVKRAVGKVGMKKKFIEDNKFLLFSDMFEGQKIGKVLSAPFGLERKWGRYLDSKDEWDPDGTYVRVQDKCLPVIMFPMTTYTITVK